jgi:hypothetical protein
MCVKIARWNPRGGGGIPGGNRASSHLFLKRCDSLQRSVNTRNRISSSWMLLALLLILLYEMCWLSLSKQNQVNWSKKLMRNNDYDYWNKKDEIKLIHG